MGEVCYINQVGSEPIQYGGIAQLGERLNGIQEVSGSIPLISTIEKHRETKGFAVFSFFAFFDRVEFVLNLNERV